MTIWLVWATSPHAGAALIGAFEDQGMATAFADEQQRERDRHQRAFSRVLYTVTQKSVTMTPRGKKKQA